jgi:hypothetical protein
VVSATSPLPAPLADPLVDPVDSPREVDPPSATTASSPVTEPRIARTSEWSDPL